MKFGFLFNRLFCAAAFALLLQQLIVATSTIWLTQLIRGVQAEHFSFIWLVLYMLSLLLPYFPGGYASTKLAQAKETAIYDYVAKFRQVYEGKIFDWSSSIQKRKALTLLSQEAPHTIGTATHFFYELWSIGLNVSLNLVIVSLLIEPYLFVTYFIGLCIAALILKIQKGRRKILALRAQQGRTNWTSIILKAWDNVLIGNVYNLSFWDKKFQQRGERLVVTSVKSQAFGQWVGIALAFALLIPSFTMLGVEAWYRSGDLIWLAMMVVVLPRLFQILGYSYELLFLISDLTVQKSQLETVLQLLEPKNIDEKEIGKRIKWDRLKILSPDDSVIPPDDLLKTIPLLGRYTLVGENGSGKTALLLVLKAKYSDKAFYLPPKSDLAFKSSLDDLSTGQKAVQELHEILENIASPIILLDEWDANLDSVHCEKVSALVNGLAKTKCVIEVRHFR